MCAARLSTSTNLGLISDTHGLIRREALTALAGVDRIIHAGDIGGQEVLAALEGVAPVSAIRGNMDHAGGWDRQLPLTAVVEVGPVSIYVLHDRFRLDLDPRAAGMAAVVFGHSHQPFVEERDGVLYINPGSAGPRRFNYPITVARLTISSVGKLVPRVIELEG